MPARRPIVPGRLAFAIDGTPTSPDYGDVFHSASGGLAQAREVFVGGNGLPERWRGHRRFVVLETGFGLGVNFLATWHAWRDDPRRPDRLDFVSIERHPLSHTDLRLALRHAASMPGTGPLAEELLARWPLPLAGGHRLSFERGRVTLTLFLGDVVDLAPRVIATWDALYLDGFAPAANAEMWSAAVLRALARRAGPDATVATWSVARTVCDALAAAGFEVEKRPGFGTKRERLVGRYVPRWRRHAEEPSRASLAQPPGHEPRSAREAHPRWADATGEAAERSGRAPAPTIARHAWVLGAGLAGSAVAHRLAASGWEVDVLDAAPQPGAGASGNPVGVFQPLISADDNVASRLTRAGMLLGLAGWRALRDGGRAPAFDVSGVIRCARDEREAARQRAAADALRLPAEWARLVEHSEASAIAGAAVASGGWWMPEAGWIRPPELCAAWLGGPADAGAGGTGASAIRVRFGARVASVRRSGGAWRAIADDGAVLASAPVAIVAVGSEVARIDGIPKLDLRRVRGQLTLMPEGSLPALRCVVAREGYVTPAVGGEHVVGATYDFDDDSLQPDARGHAGNLARLSRLLAGPVAALDPASLAGRASIRSVARDRLPLVGRLCGGPESPLLGALAFGSRGIVWAALAAEILASGLEGAPMPVEADLLAAIDPGRALRGA